MSDRKLGFFSCVFALAVPFAPSFAVAADLTITAAEISSFLNGNTGYNLPYLVASKLPLQTSEQRVEGDFDVEMVGCGGSRLMNWEYGYYADGIKNLRVSTLIDGINLNPSLYGEMSKAIRTPGSRYIQGDGNVVIEYDVRKPDGWECDRYYMPLEIDMFQATTISNFYRVNLNPSEIRSDQSSTGGPQIKFSPLAENHVRVERLETRTFASAVVNGNNVDLGPISQEAADLLSESIQEEATAEVTEQVMEEIEQDFLTAIYDVINGSVTSIIHDLLTLTLGGRADEERVASALESHIKGQGVQRAGVVLALMAPVVAVGSTYDTTSDLSLPTVNIPIRPDISDSLLTKISYSMGAGNLLCVGSNYDREHALYSLLTGEEIGRAAFVKVFGECVNTKVIIPAVITPTLLI